MDALYYGKAEHILVLVKYVPSWMPGAAWKRRGLAYRENMDRMSNVPFQFVKEQMVRGVIWVIGVVLSHDFLKWRLGSGEGDPQLYVVAPCVKSFIGGRVQDQDVRRVHLFRRGRYRESGVFSSIVTLLTDCADRFSGDLIYPRYGPVSGSSAKGQSGD